ncbi:hypothetical protein [Flavobacterium sp. LAR06]|uniref:endonuclease/exonuclease/phosphatase family protein n=1 Tax=Flavobacterium sp. LAR06 TaxID=3064897 RepID=UPI0035C09133
MRNFQARIYFIFLLSIANLQAQSKKYIIHTVAFYNFEDLFDTNNDLNTNDDEWTPTGAQHYRLLAAN